MQFIIFDEEFQTMGSIRVFNTLLWYRRYYSPGMFEFHVPAEYFDLINSGRYLYRNDRTELGVIREVDFMRGEKGEKTAYCKGYFAEHLLNNNVLYPAFNRTGTLEALSRSMIDQYIINPADSERKIRNIRLGETQGGGISVTLQNTGDNVGDRLYDTLKTQEMSQRLVFDYLGNTLTYEVWKGLDRRDTQTENSWAIFSDSFRNIKNAQYNRDETDCRNFMLFQRGLEKLADHAGIEKVDSDVDPAANLIYGTDFDLGDLCTYKYSDVNIECSKRITEIQEVLEGSKRTLSVIFGNDTVTDFKKIIRREKT